jgi:precorrin-3B synthase
MNVAPSIKGWCPSLLAPMLSGDGWLVRVKPAAAALSAAHAQLIAGLVCEHGNGHIDLTSRANLQLRGLTLESAARAAEAILAAALANPDAAVETVRNVMASPLGPDDATASFDSHAFARELESMLVNEQALHALPDKFGFLADGGGLLPLTEVTADIMVRAQGNKLAIQLDGGARAVLCAPKDAIAAAKALALAFRSLAPLCATPPRRMRALVSELGEQAVFAAGGLTSLPLSKAEAVARSSVGTIAHGVDTPGAFGIGLPFGRIEGTQLVALADLARRFGDGTLRVTPWRALLLAKVEADAAAALETELRALGLIADPADPRQRISACVGAPACASASTDTRTDATRLATTEAAHGLHIHVSGCAKGCAYAGAAAVALVGRAGRYDAVLNGHAGDAPTLTGLDMEQMVARLLQLRGSQS